MFSPRLSYLLKASLVLTCVHGLHAAPSASESREAISWSILGEKVQGTNLPKEPVIQATPSGARLRAVFQDLEAEATTEGLWMESSSSPHGGDKFRLRAMAIRRADSTATVRHFSPVGSVKVTSDAVFFLREGLVEQYSSSVDGIRQDFVVQERLAGSGDLLADLEITGASAEMSPWGALLTLQGSGREIAYSRLKVTDARGHELPARMETNGNRLSIVVSDDAAVYPVRIDPTFSDADWVSMGGVQGVDSQINALAVDAEGNLYAGGVFTVAGNVKSRGLAKWNGSEWSSMNAGSGLRSVSAILATSIDLYIAGIFEDTQGQWAIQVRRWNGSGWTPLGANGIGGIAFANITSLTAQGQDLYAGGTFTTINGVSAHNIARWDGASWHAVGTGVNNTVLALAFLGSDLYAGGAFTEAGGTTVNGIARWDGAAWSEVAGGVTKTSTAYVRTFTVDGGDLYVGGDFSRAGGIVSKNIAKWNGSQWSSLGTGLDHIVSGIAITSAGVHVVGPSQATHGIPVWNGTAWSSVGSRISGTIAIVALGDSLYVGGNFSHAGSLAVNNIARLDGNQWSAAGSGFGHVQALAVSGTDLYVGGTFSLIGNLPVNQIAKWNGQSWASLGTGMASTGEQTTIVSALAVQGSDLYATGHFETAGGVSVNHIARWNGSVWSPLSTGLESEPGYSVEGSAMAVSGTDLYVGGRFTRAGGGAANHIAKWDGSTWSSLGSGIGGIDFPIVLALKATGEDLYVGGHFATAGGVAATSVAKWNGTAWSALGAGLQPANQEDPGLVYALEVSGTDLYAGGSFVTAGGVQARNIARWNGLQWSALGEGFSSPVSALMRSGLYLYAGTLDHSAVGVYTWNGQQWTRLGTGMNRGIRAMAVVDSELYVGGDFSFAGETVAAGLIHAPEPTVSSLTVLPSQSVYAGSPVTFTVIPETGLSYQWQKDGKDISGATSGTLILPKVSYKDAGSYNLVVSSIFESTTSIPAQLTVRNPAPHQISITPYGDIQIMAGQSQQLSVAATDGQAPFTYQWRKNGINIPKATNSSLTLTNVQRAQEGVYDVVLKNSQGTGLSNTATLSLPPQVSVQTLPTDTEAEAGGSATFTSTAAGATSYQWLKDGKVIKGATGSTLTLSGVKPGDAGLYSVIITTPSGKVTTPAGKLVVNDQGLLIYKLNGTGTAYEGVLSRAEAITGYLVLDRSGQRGGLIFGTKNGSVKSHRVELHEGLHTHSTGPVPKSQTVITEVEEDAFVIWLRGIDSLLTMSKTDQTLGPKTLSGFLNSLSLTPSVHIESVTLSLTLDMIESGHTRAAEESLESALSRLSQALQSKGSALISD